MIAGEHSSRIRRDVNVWELSIHIHNKFVAIEPVGKNMWK